MEISPQNSFWKPRTGSTVDYQVISGSLPPGLALDPGTGRISGSITAMGSYSPRIGATVTSDYGSKQVAQNVPLPFNVAGLGLSYPGVQAVVGVPLGGVAPVGKQPGVNYGFSWATGFTPPAGLQIDPATGTLSGTPAQQTSFQILDIAVATTGAAPQVLQSSYSAVFPFAISYQCPVGTPNQPYTCAPTVNVNPSASSAGITVASAAFSYALAQGFVLPLGLTLDTATGVISGTPTSPAGEFDRFNVGVTLNGAAFQLPASAVITIH